MQFNNLNNGFYQRLSKWFSLALLLISLTVLFGWMADKPVLKSISSDWVSMKWNTALCLALAANCLWFLRIENPSVLVKALVSAAGLTIALTGLLTMLEYLLPIELGIDEWFIADNTATIYTSHPGRMAPLTAIALFLCGFSFPVKIIFKKSMLFQMLHFTIALIAFLAFAGYFFGVKELTGLSGYTVMALPTSVSLLLLAHAALYTETNKAFMRVITSRTIGGHLFRNSFPWLAICTLLIGWLRLKGEQANWFNPAVGISLFAVSLVAVFALIVYSSAVSLLKSETEKEREKNFTNSAIDSLPGIFYLFDHKGKFLRWNKNFEVVSGYTPEEIKSMEPLEFVPREDRAFITQNIKNGFEVGEMSTEATFVSKAGQNIPYFFTGKRLNINDYTALVGMGIDITERKKAEEDVSQKMRELEHFNLLSIGREMKMIELKKEINDLHQSLGRQPPYDLDFVNSEPSQLHSSTKKDFTEN